eukprot:185979_1
MNSKRLGICTNCNQNEGKYRCPRCSAVTCSLNCCNEHKSNNNCTGIKDKIDFVPYHAMNGDVLRKDMRFLMNLSSKIQVSSRDPLLHQRQDRNTNDRFRSLCSASKFKKIRLFLQPIGMAKHQNNQTYITKSQTNNKNILKTIHWTISIQFNTHQLLLHNINENNTLLSVLKNLKNDKFQQLKSNTIVSKIMNQNKIFDSQNNNHNMEIEHKDNILHKYYKYFDNTNLIRVPMLPKKKKHKHKKHALKHENATHNKNVSVSETIARSVIEDSVLPLFWNALSFNNPVIDDKDKLNVILKIPNHFMYIRINPMQSILEILKHKIISEHPEFIVLLPGEIDSGEYVIMDYMEHHQFDNCIKHNTNIQKQREKLKIEMDRKLNEKKLFGGKRNRYQKYKYNGKNHNKRMGGYKGKRFDERSNKNCNNSNGGDNGLSVRDLFNGNIMNDNKRCYGDMDGRSGNRGNYGTDEPVMKKMKYNENNKGKTFINPFTLNNNMNSNKQQQKQNSNQKNWYLYL